MTPRWKSHPFIPRWSFRTKRGWKAWNGSVGMGWHSALLCLATLPFKQLTIHVRHQQKSGWLPSIDEKLPSFSGGYYSLIVEQPAWWDGIKVLFFCFLWAVLDVPSCIALWAPWAPWAKRGSVQTRAFRVMNLRLDFEEETNRIERFVNLNLDWIHWIHWIQCFVFSTFKNPTELFQKTTSLITKIRDVRCNSWPKVVSDLSPGKGANGNQRTMALVGHGFRDFVDGRKSVSYIHNLNLKLEIESKVNQNSQ